MPSTDRLPNRIVVAGGHHVADFARLVSGLPSRFSFALVVACTEQSVVPYLRDTTTIPIVVVRGRTAIEHSRIYIVPPDEDAVFDGGELVLQPPHTPRAWLDRLMRSAAEVLARDSIGIVLGGAGSDGTLGIKSIKEAGGITVAQSDSDTEMPRTAIATGLVDVAVTAAEIPGRIVGLLRGGDVPGFEAQTAETLTDTLRDILTLVRVRTGHDFSSYKRATLSRRVSRRMQVCQTETLAAYHQYLREHPGELSNLLRDFLISVTNFFRDPEAFATLAETVIPKLFARPGEQVRVWVPGCATGEEAYSIAILLAEHAARIAEPPPLQIFATDIDEDALAEARNGRYPESIAVDMSPERLDKFFVRDGGHYRVTADLREMVLFSPHNLLRDPPFSRLDLVSCRNLLIYLNRDAQERVLNMFHFGLRGEGFMFLGSSESAENSAMFTPLDSKSRIFMRRVTSKPFGFDTLITGGRWTAPSPTPINVGERLPSVGDLHFRLVEHYAPPSVLVNEDLDVIHLSEHAGQFLQLAGGEPTRQLLRLVIPPLRLDLRTAIYAARQPGRRSETRIVRFEDAGKQRTVELRVHAGGLPEGTSGSILVLFHEIERTESSQDMAITSMEPPYMEPVVREIEDELHRTRDQLRNTIEQYETSLEELKASNEELQAINEELRSATEELETSKEELQSVNEELTTLNHELKLKVDEVSHANSDLQNLMTSTDIGVVFLDRSLHIKRFTPRVQDLINVIPSDLGRPLRHLTHQLATDELPQLAQSVLADLRTIEREVPSRDGRRYLARLLPYRSLEDRIEGVVLTFVDVSAQRAAAEAQARSESALKTTQDRLHLALRAAPLAIFSFDREHQLEWGFAMGQELPADGEQLAIFAADDGQKLLAIARSVGATQKSQRVELALSVDGATHVFDFRVEPTGTGVTAVGFDRSSSKTRN